MLNTGALAGKTVFITGASRGIGKAIGLKVAKDGANVVIAAKSVDKHPKLEGTIYSAAEEVEKAGGKCLPIQCDLRDEESLKSAIDKAVKHFGGLDVLVNNASAISLTGTEETTMKKFDLMHSVNTRGTFLASKYAIPHLKKASNPHILNMSPPLEMKPMWFSNHVAYTMAKYGMSMCVLGMADELKPYGIAVNALWPRTAIWTAAMAMLGGGDQEIAKRCRKDTILSDCAYAILSKSSKAFTGNFLVDEPFLKKEGITDFEQYAVKPGESLILDGFLPEELLQGDNIIDPTTVGFGSPSKASEAQSGGKIDHIFQTIEKLINDDMRKEINACLAFIVSGQSWLIDANTSRPLKVAKEVTDTADVTFTMDDKTFEQMASGSLKATNAFMAGKLKIKGNIGIAMKTEKLFAGLKSKL